MAPRDKAKNIMSLFGKIELGLTENGEPYLMAQDSLRETRQCARILVEEMIQQFTNKCCESANVRYWQEVKEEINKIKTI